MKSEPQKEYDDLLAKLVQARQRNEKPMQKPKLADILTKARESLAGVNLESYWIERERELAESRASWNRQEDNAWRG